MKKTALCALAIFPLFLCIPREAHAGAWTVPQYKIWSELYTKGVWATDSFTSDYDRARLPREAKYWEYQIEPKFEYGVTNWLTALGSVTWFDSYYKEYHRPSEWGSYSVKNNGLKQVAAGGRLRLIKDPLVISTQLKGSFWPGYDTSKAPAPGHGDDSLELRALLGKTFEIPLWKDYNLPCIIGLESGYRWRSKDVANDIPFFIEGGFSPVKWLLLKGEIDGYKSHKHTGKQIEDYAIWRAGVVYLVFGNSIQRQGILFNIEAQYGQTFWGKNTNAGQEVIIKFQTQF